MLDHGNWDGGKAEGWGGAEQQGERSCWTHHQSYRAQTKQRGDRREPSWYTGADIIIQGVPKIFLKKKSFWMVFSKKKSRIIELYVYPRNLIKKLAF